MKNISKIIPVVAPIALLLIFFILWELFIRVLRIPRWILPGPISIFYVASNSFEEFVPHILSSVIGVVAGFVLAIPIGIAISAIISNYRIAGSAFTPYILFLITTPMVALIPLIMLWIGVGIKAKIIAITIQCTGIIMLNSTTGFSNVPWIRLELMESLRASKFTTFIRAVLPSSLPYVFTGMKLGAIFSIVTAIGAEFVGGTIGLGALIIKNTQFIRTEKAFACIFFVAIIGVALYSIVALVEKFVVRER